MQETMNKKLTKVASECLQTHFERNKDFRDEFMGYIYFYSQKFLHILKEEYHSEFEKVFEEVTKSQFYQGYYLMLEIINDNETVIQPEFLTQPIGYLTNEVPGMLNEGFKGKLKDIIRTSITQNFVLWMITKFEDVFDLLNQVIYDITCLGARQALIDERNKLEENTSAQNQCWLGDGYDYNFISPQAYIILKTKTPQIESWDIQWWSTLNNSRKIGEVTALHVVTPEEEINGYILNIQISKQMAESEIMNAARLLSTILSTRNNIEFSDMLINVSIVEESFQLVQDSK
ncbi:hypothetical protein ACFVAD_18885 [Sutcliffiella sp. NPDC057660]|uniref:hypothetical protein n=1 Tax=Sutcliffiella sp. NPDC057660 TaxID=3346199 RepID=UPI0036903F22